MIRPAMVAVQAVPGRETLTRATIEALHDHGGAAGLELPPVLCWTGLDAPPFPLPPRWSLCHWQQAPAGHRRELWRILEVVPDGSDLVLFEDDVLPCRNAVPHMARWQGPHLTTFFRMDMPGARRPPGLRLVDPKWGFWGSQALKIPAPLVARYIAAGDTDRTRKVFLTDGGDTRLGRLLQTWKEPIYYHRSVVQHVGAQSIHNPGATLTGLRAPAVDFDPNLDALTLPEAP